MAHFITFEGIEGSGKTTQIAKVAELLRGQGYNVVTTREPGGCPISNAIREILLNPANDALENRAELLLYAAARAQHVAEVIQPALKQGQIVLCDRYTDATLAYQGYGRGLDLDLIEELNTLASGDCRPHLTLLLDMPHETGLKRALERNDTQNMCDEGRFEQESLDFHKRVREGYLFLAQKDPQRMQVIDATGTPAEVSERLIACLQAYLDSGTGS
ncbi:dTMP kinase [Syntrophotalea acetylenivorans]|uniref:Thymidylate kinase n=1 Tax=Syntrophotalea acetylenivorans TaxID=1842532 RepID=A0A1L3GM93_9BACT|nr:dTMP kinase [Syntrophotalea acetylenivorans]APG26798.1 dTMP kinase [Syntrophotalea acetylenivorans]